MLPYIVAGVLAIIMISPETTVGLLPGAVNEEEKQAIQRGLEITQEGVRDTRNAVMNVILRVWMGSKGDGPGDDPFDG